MVQSWIFSILTPVFSVTWFIRTHSNMLICCSRKILLLISIFKPVVLLHIFVENLTDPKFWSVLYKRRYKIVFYPYNTKHYYTSLTFIVWKKMIFCVPLKTESHAGTICMWLRIIRNVLCKFTFDAYLGVKQILSKPQSCHYPCQGLKVNQ